MTETRKKDIAKEYIKENIEFFWKELNDFKKDLNFSLNDVKSILWSENVWDEDNKLKDVDIFWVDGIINVLFKKNWKQRTQVWYELLKSIFIKEESKQKLDLLYEALKKSKTEEELRQSLNKDLSQLQSNVLWDNWNSNQNNNKTNNTSQQPDISAVDTSGFTPWEKPFAHIKTPYKWISAYRVDNIKLKPLIWFSQLSLKWTEGPLSTLKVKNIQEKLVQGTAWYNKKNPCNVSPFEWDVWRTSASKVADWQNHSQYESMEAWLASFMRLMRQPRYRNKSIQWINCSWMQWIYKESEPDSLKALRITRITHACENLNISPFARLNTDDKETMMAFTQQTAIRETWCHFSKDTLEKAYKLAFPNEA